MKFEEKIKQVLEFFITVSDQITVQYMHAGNTFTTTHCALYYGTVQYSTV